MSSETLAEFNDRQAKRYNALSEDQKGLAWVLFRSVERFADTFKTPPPYIVDMTVYFSENMSKRQELEAALNEVAS